MKAMKMIRTILLTVGTLCFPLLFQSCLDNDDDYDNTIYPNALVTVKQADDKSVFLQLDDKTTLFPVNLTSSPFGTKEVRALVNYKEVSEPNKGYTKAVYVNWIDSLLTKPMVLNLGVENDAKYGNDRIEVIKDWVTIAEDGYLTLRLRMIIGNQSKIHSVNLLVGGNPNNPYEVELRHNAFDDIEGRIMDALVAFKLDKLPDTNGKTVKLKLKWKSYDGDKSVEFDYNSRVATLGKPIPAGVRSTSNLQ